MNDQDNKSLQLYLSDKELKSKTQSFKPMRLLPLDLANCEVNHSFGSLKLSSGC